MLKHYILFCLLFRIFSVQGQGIDCNQPINKPIITVSKVDRPSVPAQTAVCEDSIVQLNLKNYAKGKIVQWTLNNTAIPNANDTLFIIRNNQTGTYRCTVKNGPLCTAETVSDPIVISMNPKPTVSVTVANPTGTLCVDGFVKLTAVASGNGFLNYQWLQENRKIDGAASSFYDAAETGVYSVKVTDTNGCANVSGNTTVISNTPPKAEIRASKSGFCKGNTVTLYSTRGRTNIYQWMRDGQPIGGVKDSVIVSQAGLYSVKVTAPNSCTATSLSLTIIQYPEPIVTIESSGDQLCRGATLPLTAKGVDLKKFQWSLNGQPINGAAKNVFNAAQTGTYSVAVIDTNGCKAVSKDFEIKEVAKITVKIDSIPDFCGTSGAPVILKGIPLGGIFTGTGIVNGMFDPKLAGIGQHSVTYTVQGSLECLNGEAQRTVTVSNPPAINLGEDKIIFKGASITLNAELGVGYSYQWTPTSGVENPDLPITVVIPERTTTYHVTAQGPKGCFAQDSITLQVFSGLYIPEVFTPNGDGQNDTWELKGLEEYPEAEITIMNRWGQAIFSEKGSAQKPFDGTLNGDALPVGEYAYVIRTEPNGHVLRGKVLLLR